VAILRSGSQADYFFETKGYSGDLRVINFTGEEGLSRLFCFQLELTSDDWEIDLDAVVGKAATFSIKSHESERAIHGIVARMEMGGKGEKFAPYRVELVPEVWLLTRVSRSRIFQKKTVREIAQEVFKEAGVPTSRFRFALKRTLPAREYCVQYRETDWNFVSRLLEEEGIFYFFEQKDKETVLVMGDSPDAVVAIASPDKIPFREPSGAVTDREAVYDFRFAQELKSGKSTLKDYNFTRPDVQIEGSASAARDDKLEIYDYPGYYVVKENDSVGSADKFPSGDLANLGKDIAKIRLEEAQALRLRAEGMSVCRRFIPGFRFELEGHHRGGFNAGYLLTWVRHSGAQPATPAAGASKITYENRFACIPKEVVFRPERVTPKPAVKGVQTALVTGPSGEEIYTDFYGRVKVQFPWDRLGKKDDKSSCWVRVASAWAGKSWGAIYTPRIGQEVVVDFLEGDPDRPIITGRVYNGNNQPPYKLPEEKTKSTLKSDSTKGGGGFNEYRFEDVKGSEEIYQHAQKDLTIKTENDKNQNTGHDETLSIGNNRTKSVGKNESTTVGENRTESVGKNESITIGGSRTESVGKNESISIGEKRTESVGKDESITIGNNKTESVAKNSTLDVGENKSVSIGKNLSVSVSKSIAEKAGESIALQADKDITIQCGSASITLKKDGKISIQGADITVKGSGNVTIKGSKIAQN
jgi:type VI secretion system secreted protein VgrG